MVSIPERVWWFVELSENHSFTRWLWFQSLKGFGGLWNIRCLALVGLDPLVSIPERVWWFVEPGLGAIASAEGFGVSIPERVWWFVERRLRRCRRGGAAFQSLKGFGGLWNAA